MAGTRTTGAPRARVRRKAPAKRRRRAWWASGGAAVAAALIALALVPDLPGGAGAGAVAAAATAPVANPNGFSTSGGFGAIVVPAPAVAAPPTMVVPHPVVVPQAVVPPYVPHGVAPKTSPPPARCGGYSTPRSITPTVVPGTGAATVSFPSDPSTDVQGYRVQAVSETLTTGTQPPHVVATAGQRTGCGTVTVTLGGLTSGQRYVFWLEEEQVDATNGKTQFVQVGTSQPVLVG